MHLPNDVQKQLNGKTLDEIKAHVKYKNWKGEVSVRTIIPLSIYHGSTEYHKEEQWLLKLWDLDKNDYRTYAVKEIIEWIK